MPRKSLGIIVLVAVALIVAKITGLTGRLFPPPPAIPQRGDKAEGATPGGYNPTLKWTLIEKRCRVPRQNGSCGPMDMTCPDEKLMPADDPMPASGGDDVSHPEIHYHSEPLQ